MSTDAMSHVGHVRRSPEVASRSTASVMPEPDTTPDRRTRTRNADWSITWLALPQEPGPGRTQRTPEQGAL
jgi:hypothetical protein